MTCLHGGGICAIEQRVQLRLAFSLVLARIQWRAAAAITACHVRRQKALVSEVLRIKNPK
jgi:hypothetical protein